MIVYKVGKTQPIAVECEKFGYPYFDSDGEQMYENTHFITEEEAWGAVLSAAQALFELSVRDVKDKRSMLHESEQRLIKHSIQFDEARQNRLRFLEKTT